MNADLAKGAKAVHVPWKKITEEPDKFDDLGFMPVGIAICDPSKMVKNEIEACFRLWKKKEARGKQPFQFKQVYSSQRGFQVGWGRRVIDSDSDDESADTYWALQACRML